MVCLVAGGVLALTLRGLREGARRARYRPPFSAAGASAWRPDGSVWRVDGTLRRPTVVLYVTWSCPHCRAELERWRKVLARGPVEPELAIWVVAEKPAPPELELPDALRVRVLRDRDAATARVLGIEVVPTTVSIAPGGTVVERVRGETSVERVRRLVERLRGTSAGAPPS